MTKFRLMKRIHGNWELLGGWKSQCPHRSSVPAVAMATGWLTWLSLLPATSTWKMSCPSSWGLWGRGGLQMDTDESQTSQFWPHAEEKKLTKNSSDPVKQPLLVKCWTLITTMCLEDISKSPSQQCFGLGCVTAAYFALKLSLKRLVWVSFPVWFGPPLKMKMYRFGEAHSILIFILSDILTVFSVVWMQNYR